MKMLVNHKYAVMIIVAILVMASLTVFLSTASAQEPPSDVSSYGSQNGSGNFFIRFLGNIGLLNTSQLVGNSPSGCEQSAHNPHRSTHYPGTVNAEIRATCNNAVPEMYHTSTLMKSGGFLGLEWSVADVGQFSGISVSVGSAYGNDLCENRRYKGIGDGWVIDVDDNVYIAATGSREVNNPCRL